MVTAAKGTNLGRSAGKEDPVELDSSLTRMTGMSTKLKTHMVILQL